MVSRPPHCSVDLPVEEVPPELPEPVLGINFARDGEPFGGGNQLVVDCLVGVINVDCLAG